MFMLFFVKVDGKKCNLKILFLMIIGNGWMKFKVWVMVFYNINDIILGDFLFL